MSDYRDILGTAFVSGFTPDVCGTSERYYTWGSFIDLCGMSVEDYMKEASCGGGGNGQQSGGTQTKNTITLSMQPGSDGTYHVKAVAEKVSEADVIVSFNMEGVGQQVIVIPAGAKEVVSTVSSADGSKYAIISGAVATSEDERYKYSVKNTIETGYFELVIIKDGEKTVETVKYDTNVTVPVLDDKYGYDPVYTINTTAGTETIESVDSGVTMPESNTTIEIKYNPKDVEVSYSTTREVLNVDTPEEVVVSNVTETVKFDSKVSDVIGGVAPEEGYSIVYEYEGNEYTESEFKNEIVKTIDPVSVSVKYRLNKYSLSYSVGGTVVKDDELYFTQATTEPSDETVSANMPTGQKFVKWSDTIPEQMPAKDLSVTAVIEPIDYTITFIVNVDKFDTPETAATYTLHYGDAVQKPSDPEKEGYTFEGWQDSVPETMPAENIVITGHLSINTYHFALYVDGKVYFEKDYEYGETIDTTEITEPSKEGYTFQGWEPEIPQTVPASDVAINAVFTVNQYTIEYYVDNVLYDSQTLDYGTELVAIAEPEKEGYTFSGWSAIPATMPVGGVRVDGTFQINSYVLSYYVDNELVESAETEYNAQITAKAEPEKEGYTFSGWSDIPERMPAHDVRIDGTFTVNRWAIRYFVDGEEYFVDEHNYGDSITIIDIPEPKVGYTFSGWTYDEIPATMPDHDIEINGVFIINTHTFTFYLDGEVYSSITADYGTTGITIENPTADTGYHFEGWKNSDGDEVTVPDTMPDEDLSFYGAIKINIHVASYYVTDENGNRTLNSKTEFEYGSTITYPEIQVPEGYILKWNKEYSTMPDIDIDIEGLIEDFVESNMIYYGFVNTNLPKSLSTEGLSSYENVDGEQKETVFVLHGDPRYAELETDEQFDQWDIDEMHDYNVLAPSKLSVSILDAAKNPVGGIHVAATGDIDGTEYNLYSAPAAVAIDTDMRFTIYIKASKN